ncbi:hypothetical protein BD779DRAFT_1675236 [Infundibulicybe gibba]|nr:hypothetical protein BD779DRAFT_1675236 [Infundibulicybe gibba]
MALTVWDHVITFDSEVSYIWSRSRLPLVTKIAYVSNRYIADAMLVFAAYWIIPQNLETFLGISILIDCVVIAFTQTIVAREIFNLWERRKTVAHLLIIISTTCIPALLIAAIQCVRIDLGFIFVLPGATFCGFATFKSLWIQIALGIMAVFDLLIILLVISNALARPRRTNHDLIFTLHRDGAAMYTAVFVTRIVGFAIAITSTSYVVLLPAFVISTTINCRLTAQAAKLHDHIGRGPAGAEFDKEVETYYIILKALGGQREGVHIRSTVNHPEPLHALEQRYNLPRSCTLIRYRMALQIPSVPANAVSVLFASKYLSAFSLALSVWDHVITLDHEILYIWSRSRLPFVTKVAYLSNRYITNAVLVLAAYSIVAWEIFNQWERRKPVARLLIIISIICVPALFTAVVECALNDFKFTLALPGAMFCGVSSFKSPWVQTSFGILTVFDLVIILLVISNAMARPRRNDYDLIFALHRDGVVMYTAVLAIRIVGFVIAMVYDVS